MNIPRVWVKVERDVIGKHGPMRLAGWGWSGGDHSEAERRANERLHHIMSRVEQSLELTHGYAYGTRPLREEIVQELHVRTGDLAAVVTRNSYGCLVLNTSQVMFVDVDLRQPALSERFWGLLGRKRRNEDETLDRIKTQVRDISRANFRIYRTAGGFRLLFTDRLFQPASPESENIMKAVGADAAYVKLCQLQESFRARLTPKPWRCRCSKPPSGYPRENDFDKEKFSQWLAEYDRRCAKKTTCRLLEEVGGGWIHEQVQPILKLHDDATKTGLDLPLA